MKQNLQRLVLRSQEKWEINSVIILPPEQQHYLRRVLRLTEGAEFIALNGEGKRWRACLALDQALLLEEMSANTELAVEISLAIAMPKGNGMEEVIRQVTELGANQILPLWSDRTVVKPGTSMGKAKLERWTRIAEETAEQALRTYVPQILEPQAFNDFIKNSSQLAKNTHKYICVTQGHTEHLLNCLQSSELPQQIIVLTGAEGGWTESEQQTAIAHNFQPVSLGDRILAAVTAPIVALSLISAVTDASRQPNQLLHSASSKDSHQREDFT